MKARDKARKLEIEDQKRRAMLVLAVIGFDLLGDWDDDDHARACILGQVEALFVYMLTTRGFETGKFREGGKIRENENGDVDIHVRDNTLAAAPRWVEDYCPKDY